MHNHVLVKKTDLKVGQTVFVSTFNQEANILSISTKNDDIQVQIGSIKTKVNIKDISKIIENKKEPNTVSASFKSNIKNKNVPLEINIIGLNVLEAEPIIDKYLDDCMQAKLTEVRIVPRMPIRAAFREVQHPLHSVVPPESEAARSVTAR